MKWMIIGSTFISALIFSFWFIRYLDMRRMNIKKRVIAIEKKDWHEEEETGQRINHQESKISSAAWVILSKIKLLRVLEERLEGELKKANIPMKSSELVSIIVLSGLLGGLIGIVLAGGNIGQGIWLGLFSWILPLIWLKNKRNNRKKKLEAQLPEMITMITNSLKAGHSLIQSIELLSREMNEPLSEEFGRLLQEMRLGVTTEQALKSFNKRIESTDLDLIVTAMLIQRQVGGNLAEILDSIGSTIRERIKIQGEMKSLTAQGRMSMTIFMIMPIGLAGFLFMTNAKYMMTLFTHPIGWFMILIAIVGQIIGSVIIRKIIHIEV